MMNKGHKLPGEYSVHDQCFTPKEEEGVGKGYPWDKTAKPQSLGIQVLRHRGKDIRYSIHKILRR